MSSQFGAGLRHFPMHVLPSQAVKRSGLCCRHSVPAWLTPALHLISFLFLGCQNRYVNALNLSRAVRRFPFPFDQLLAAD